MVFAAAGRLKSFFFILSQRDGLGQWVGASKVGAVAWEHALQFESPRVEARAGWGNELFRDIKDLAPRGFNECDQERLKCRGNLSRAFQMSRALIVVIFWSSRSLAPSSFNWRWQKP